MWDQHYSVAWNVGRAYGDTFGWCIPQATRWYRRVETQGFVNKCIEKGKALELGMVGHIIDASQFLAELSDLLGIVCNMVHEEDGCADHRFTRLH